MKIYIVFIVMLCSSILSFAQDISLGSIKLKNGETVSLVNKSFSRVITFQNDQSFKLSHPFKADDILMFKEDTNNRQESFVALFYLSHGTYFYRLFKYNRGCKLWESCVSINASGFLEASPAFFPKKIVLARDNPYVFKISDNFSVKVFVVVNRYVRNVNWDGERWLSFPDEK